MPDARLEAWNHVLDDFASPVDVESRGLVDVHVLLHRDRLQGTEYVAVQTSLLLRQKATMTN